jgi:hypothetical protein
MSSGLRQVFNICLGHKINGEGSEHMTNEATNLKGLKRLWPRQLRMGKIVGVKINNGGTEFQTVAKAAGATWDIQAKLWLMPERVAMRSILTAHPSKGPSTGAGATYFMPSMDTCLHVLQNSVTSKLR